jgi:voltage-gated potassium channel
MNHSTPSEGRLGVFEFAILILTILVLSALVWDTVTVLPKGIVQIIHWMDTAVCAVFLVDFGIRFHRAESKWQFMKWGWIDLVASIPNIDFLRWGRLVRVLRVIRLLRGIRSMHRVIQLIFRDSAKGGFVSIGLTAFLLVVFSSVSILICERSPEANIKSGEDAVWWSISTVTTVGYGDKYPTTTEGRILGMVLMTAGVGLFGGLSGLVASLFLGAREKRSPEHGEIIMRLDQLQKMLEELNQRTHEGGEGGSGRVEISQ